MTDWNKTIVLPTHLGIIGRGGLTARAKYVLGVAGGSSQTWQTANSAGFYPFRVPYAYPVRRVWWINGATVGGHADFGIYNAGGRRLFSTGSILTAGASSVQYVTVATPFILGPGFYYLAWANDGTTTRAWGWTGATSLVRELGVLTQLSAFPLPDPATFAQAPATQIIEHCGVTRTASGF